jgi:hypothetical protein
MVPLPPGAQVFLGTEMIRLVAIAGVMDEYEVVPEVRGIPRPWDEVIHVGERQQRLATVEAITVLHVPEDRPIDLQAAALLGEQKRPEVSDIAEFMDIELLHKPYPRALDHVTQ